MTTLDTAARDDWIYAGVRERITASGVEPTVLGPDPIQPPGRGTFGDEFVVDAGSVTFDCPRLDAAKTDETAGIEPEARIRS